MSIKHVRDGELIGVSETQFRLPTDQEVRIYRAALALDNARVGLGLIYDAFPLLGDPYGETEKAERAVQRARAVSGARKGEGERRETMMDMNKAAEALKALGVDLEVKDKVKFVDAHLWINDIGDYWMPCDYETPGVEVHVRTAVLKVAPGSCASRVWDADGKLTDDIFIELFDETGDTLCHTGGLEIIAEEAKTYTEAWINAAIALYEAGRAPQGKGGIR